MTLNKINSGEMSKYLCNNDKKEDNMSILDDYKNDFIVNQEYKPSNSLGIQVPKY